MSSGRRQVFVAPSQLSLLWDTHSVTESVRMCIFLASKQGAVMSYCLTPGSMKVIGQKADEVQVSIEEWMQGKEKSLKAHHPQKDVSKKNRQPLIQNLVEPSDQTRLLDLGSCSGSHRSIQRKNRALPTCSQNTTGSCPPAHLNPYSPTTFIFEKAD